MAIKNIALVQCPCSYPKIPPPSLAALSSSLKEDYKITIFDLNAEFYNTHKRTSNILNKMSSAYYLLNLNMLKKISSILNQNIINDWALKILSSEPFIVGFTLSRNNLMFTLNLAKKLKEKKKDLKIIVGGPVCYEPFLKKYRSLLESKHIDIIISGDGENTLNSVIKDLEAGKKIDKLIKSKPTPLESLALPDYSQFDFNNYFRQIYINSSRGCINNCNFCVENKLYGHYRQKTPIKFAEELKTLKEKYYLKSFILADSLINGSISWLNEFCDYLIKNKIELCWQAGAAIRTDLSLELLKKMKQAGCKTLLYGIESGSDTLLRKMNKHYDNKTARDIIKKTKQARINVITNWIVNFPNETFKESIQTLKFIQKNKRFIDGYYLSNYGITPGSEVYKNPEKFGLKNKKSLFWKSKNSNILNRIVKYAIFKIYLKITISKTNRSCLYDK